MKFKKGDIVVNKRNNVSIKVNYVFEKGDYFTGDVVGDWPKIIYDIFQVSNFTRIEDIRESIINKVLE